MVSVILRELDADGYHVTAKDLRPVEEEVRTQHGPADVNVITPTGTPNTCSRRYHHTWSERVSGDGFRRFTAGSSITRNRTPHSSHRTVHMCATVLGLRLRSAPRCPAIVRPGDSLRG